ncbi:hypothetical protein HMPREF9999_00881 [Alloprevotella sp. oral taxon 473 str. F0040]|nr:hypothetical protein HMPREF9999_00881 [Alloprevotella sp. oral taxon 473 str. F0040]
MKSPTFLYKSPRNEQNSPSFLQDYPFSLSSLSTILGANI